MSEIAVTACANCGVYAALTTKWLGTGCGTCAARMGYQHLPNWCERCVTVAQIAYVESVAAKLPELREKLDALGTTEGTGKVCITGHA